MCLEFGLFLRVLTMMFGVLSFIVLYEYYCETINVSLNEEHRNIISKLKILIETWEKISKFYYYYNTDEINYKYSRFNDQLHIHTLYIQPEIIRRELYYYYTNVKSEPTKNPYFTREGFIYRLILLMCTSILRIILVIMGTSHISTSGTPWKIDVIFLIIFGVLLHTGGIALLSKVAPTPNFLGFFECTKELTVIGFYQMKSYFHIEHDLSYVNFNCFTDIKLYTKICNSIFGIINGMLFIFESIILVIFHNQIDPSSQIT